MATKSTPTTNRRRLAAVPEPVEPVAKKAPARKATAKKATPAKPVAKKATPAKKATKAAPAAKVTVDMTAAIERVRALRAEGQSWRLLSATLNDEGVKTTRGKTWAANGTTAWNLAQANGIA